MTARGGRAAGCTVLHVDMDAFFASVEVRRHPELAGTPVIVGGAGNRGVVTSATYEARRYGVHAAMPTARALRLCPTATVLPGDLALYSEVSRSVMALFRSITPLVEPLSLDEAFLDVRGAGRRLGDAAEIGEYIRARVFDEQGITCSVGVAPDQVRRQARLHQCQARRDARRPPGRGHGLPAPAAGRCALWGVGPKTEEVLLRLGLRTVGDLAHVPAKTLQRAVGAAVGQPPARAGLGPGPAPGRPRRAGEVDRARGDVRAPTSTTRRSSTGSCCCCPSGRRAGCARAAGWRAR